MSKKKTFSGSTMTLKDFHGGSIPSDLPLPSAPGVIPRPTDRSGFDRQSSWGNSMGGRSDHRLRPSSSGSMRNLDENKIPFLTSTANIGRNFDEDERKPLDGGASAPRRIVSDDSSIGVSVVRSEPRGDGGKFSGQPSLGPVAAHMGGGSGSSYSARVVDGGHSGVGINSRPNAWGVKKEVRGSEVGSSPWSGQSAVSKFAQASALDQISSGRWQTKPVQHQADVEVIRQSDSPNSLYGREGDFYGGGVNFASEREYYETTLVSKFAQASALDQISSGRWQTKPVQHQVDVEVIRQSDSPNSLYGREGDSYGGSGNFASEREYYENTLARHVESSLVIEEGTHGGFKEVSSVERVHSPVQTSVMFTNEGQPAHPDGKYGGPLLQHPQPQPPEISERPKLKLLPRTKPLDVQEPSAVDYRQGFQQPIDTAHSEAGKTHGNTSYVKPRPSSSEANHGRLDTSGNEAAGIQVVERPKLSLKPRPQPAENAVGSIQRERKALFGGARPREMILKERGVHDVVNSHDEVQGPSRIKNDSPRAEVVAVAPVHANTSRHVERVDNISNEQRTGRGHEKRDQRADVQRGADMQKKKWRNDNWRSTEKPQQQERQPSPETWRKPVENSGLRFGKAVSAVDLAQAFSRSVSSPKPVDQFSGQRVLPGQKGLPVRTQVPFSRLTGSTRSQINGY
ncbi:hypothetical protein SOVF_117010 [Spinacia oleracea]|uniref:DUF4005 domain-containing protein n=1 Tax=Spinacia oleracea TaxID=3562 RepID=A0A9R0JWW7_SPIOL|nr:uncharacterized protein LOC110789693 [Spinacia oleracea]KNA13433.1 hypothetical protein SOVF_117010 [Spinacia oleracea]